MPRDGIAPHALRVTIGQNSVAGRKSVQQDFHGATVPEGTALIHKGIAVALADGISSCAVSAEAAEMAVKALMIDYYQTSDAWSVKTAAATVITALNAWLYAHNRRDGTYDVNRGRVCTLSALVLKHRTAHLFHAGDSRIWRVSGDTLEPLTSDHRMVVSESESYLARALGMADRVEIDHRSVALHPGDVFLLSTDGVHDHWSPRAVMQQIREHGPEAAEIIVEDALAAGSPDNLTLQIIRIDDVPARDATHFMDDLMTLPHQDLPEPGSTLDGFRIIHNVHANARSHIFLAQTAQGACVALKFPSHDLRDDPAYLRRFVMEEWIARRLTSPHVLGAAIAPPARSRLYTVTPYIRGQTLRQWMTDTPRPTLSQVHDITDQIIRGVRAFHRHEMLH